jgi:hypothetical protein
MKSSPVSERSKRTANKLSVNPSFSLKRRKSQIPIWQHAGGRFADKMSRAFARNYTARRSRHQMATENTACPPWREKSQRVFLNH